MNIFFLHDDPRVAAQLQADVHVVKMILETMQLLCTALHLSRTPCIWPFELYKPTHINHPSAKWVRHSISNFNWAMNHGYELCLEYTKRYGKLHKCQEYYEKLQSFPIPTFKRLSQKEYKMDKVSFHGIPNSVQFVAIAIADDVFKICSVYDDNHNLLAIPTYKNYYIHKMSTIKRKMKWYNDDKLPHELENVAKKMKNM
jgi:hypothetical protein